MGRFPFEWYHGKYFRIKGKWFKTAPVTIEAEGVPTGILTEGVPGS